MEENRTGVSALDASPTTPALTAKVVTPDRSSVQNVSSLESQPMHQGQRPENRPAMCAPRWKRNFCRRGAADPPSERCGSSAADASRCPRVAAAPRRGAGALGARSAAFAVLSIDLGVPQWDRDSVVVRLQPKLRLMDVLGVIGDWLLCAVLPELDEDEVLELGKAIIFCREGQLKPVQ